MRTFLKLITPLAFLIFFGVASFFIYQFSLNDLKVQENSHFVEMTRNIQQSLIDQGFREYVESLQSIHGLFMASVSVERDEWSTFIQSTRVQETYPASRTFSFLKHVLPNERSGFVENVRKDTSINPKGYPEFTITPEKNDEEAYVVTYVEPQQYLYETLGANRFADSLRRTAIELARDTGKFATTKPFFIEGRSYFSIYLPLYRNNAHPTTVEERRNTIQGIAAVTIDIGALFNPIFTETEELKSTGRIELFDISQDVSLSGKNLIYEIGMPQSKEMFQTNNGFLTDTIPFGANGVKWIIRVSTPSNVGISKIRQLYPEILSIGITLLGALISLFIFFVTNSRNQALHFAEILLEKLRKTEKRLIETAPDMIIVLDKEGRFISANDEAQSFFGYPFEQIKGKHFASIGALENEPLRIATDEFMRVLRGERREAFELTIATQKGEIKDIEAHASIIKENDVVTGIQVIFRDITTRKKVEEALKESEEKFRILSEQLPAMIFINKRGHVVYTNKKSEETLGYTKEEFYAHSFDFRTLIAPEYREKTQKDFELHMQGKDVPPVEYELLKKDGKRISVVQSTRLIRYEGERAILGIVTDVTTSKEAQQQIALQLAITKAMAESTTTSEAIQKTLENIGTIFRWRYGSFFKIENEEKLVATHSWHAPDEINFDIYNQSTEKLSLQKGAGGGVFLREVWESKKPLWISNILKHKDFIRKEEGKILGLQGGLAFPIKTKGEVVGIFEFFDGEKVQEPGLKLFETLEAVGEQFNQFLEKIKREEELKRHFLDLQKFQWAVESTSDHILITDTEGIIQYANKAAEITTGYSIKEMVGTKVGKLWGHHMPSDYYKNLWDTLKIEKRPFHGEVENKRKNGEDYTAELSISPIFDEQGNEKLFVAIERDVTREREIDRAKSEFVSLASHQLRTPLTAINWYAEMLKDEDEGPINEKQKNYLQEILNGGRRLVDLVNSLLNVSRIELGTFAIEPTVSDIVGVCKSAIKELEPQIAERKIIFTQSFAESIPPLNIDEKLMHMIFQNLLSNAVGYTPEGGKVSISIGKNNESIRIEITDTGIGIPQASQDKIFTKLYRADNAHETKPDGTGLGLYIVKAVVENAGGKIWFESKEGKGTSFYVTIPLKGMKSKEGMRGLIPM
ncbi:MAG: PAS domain S-box protein [Candidatus Paceibacterota bacterium]|jgi:PAS domain S-box-containing protein